MRTEKRNARSKEKIWHCLYKAHSYKNSILIVLLILIVYIYTAQKIIIVVCVPPNVNVLSKRPWPPIKIYYHHLPSEFNSDGIAKVPAEWFNETSQYFQFAMEYYFAQFMEQVPILTNDIIEADFVYFDFLPFFTALQRKEKQQSKMGKRLYKNLKENNLTRRRLFSIYELPWLHSISNYILGYTGIFELMKNNHKWIVVPYLSNFSNFPPSALNISAPRNITVFLSGSYRAQRKKIFQIIENSIPNSLRVVINRRNSTNLYNSIVNTP